MTFYLRMKMLLLSTFNLRHLRTFSQVLSRQIGPIRRQDSLQSYNKQNYQVYTVYANTNMANTWTVCPIYMVLWAAHDLTS